MSRLVEIQPEYVYVCIPAEYVCVYHRILAMMADFGEEMLKDCKASCTDKNSGVIECFNMFNAAVAARKLNKLKLAETLIKYIKEKINMIYKGHNNSTSFVFPIDENGEIKAFVSCGERVKFEINPDDMELYEHKFGDGFSQHFTLGAEDESEEIDENIDDSTSPVEENGLAVTMTPYYEFHNGSISGCCELVVKFNGEVLDSTAYTVDYYIDDVQVDSFLSLTDVEIGESHTFMTVVKYGGDIAVNEEICVYENPDN